MKGGKADAKEEDKFSISVARPNQAGMHFLSLLFSSFTYPSAQPQHVGMG